MVQPVSLGSQSSFMAILWASCAADRRSKKAGRYHLPAVTLNGFCETAFGCYFGGTAGAGTIWMMVLNRAGSAPRLGFRYPADPAQA